jgi:hypothetical protein
LKPCCQQQTTNPIKIRIRISQSPVAPDGVAALFRGALRPAEAPAALEVLLVVVIRRVVLARGLWFVLFVLFDWDG